MRTLEFQLAELVSNLRRNGILSVAAVMTVMAALAILSLFYLVEQNFQSLLDEQTQKARISAFLKSTVSGDQLSTLRGQIEGLPGVARVEYVSSDAALERMKKSLELKDEELKLLGGESRLPAKYEVQPSDATLIGALAKQLKALPGVEDVRYGEKVVAPLNELRRRCRQWGWGAFLVLSLATCGIISNAIRLTIYARRREIRIMQLVGATNGFIRTPFVLEGLVHGLVGGLLALAATSLLYAQVKEASADITWLKLISLEQLMPTFAVVILALGILFGVGSSVLSIRHFLREA